MRKFRRASESAIAIIKHAERRIDNLLHCRGRELSSFAFKRFRMPNCILDQPRLLDHITIFFAECLRNCDQHAFKAGASVVIMRRKVGAAIKRLSIRSEKAGKWPTALPAD